LQGTHVIADTVRCQFQNNRLLQVRLNLVDKLTSPTLEAEEEGAVAEKIVVDNRALQLTHADVVVDEAEVWI
jgi:hypothetical protein